MTQQQNPLERLFARLYQGAIKPFNLPLSKVYLAPADPTKFNAFFASYKANGWLLDEALLPYTNDKLIEICAFYDLELGDYRFCTWAEVLLRNGYRVTFAKDEISV